MIPKKDGGFMFKMKNPGDLHQPGSSCTVLGAKARWVDYTPFHIKKSTYLAQAAKLRVRPPTDDCHGSEFGVFSRFVGLITYASRLERKGAGASRTCNPKRQTGSAEHISRRKQTFLLRVGLPLLKTSPLSI